MQSLPPVKEPVHADAPPQLIWIAAAALPGLLVAGYYVLLSFRLAGEIGFPLDDSWIHAQFARNLATGRGFTYSGPEWVSGSTAPLWTVLLALVYMLVSEMVAAAVLLGVLMHGAVVWYTVRLCRLLGCGTVLSYLGGALSGVLPVLVWGTVSGMEVTLAAALVMGGLFHVLAWRGSGIPVLGVTLLGLSALARPESLAIAGVVAFAQGFRAGTWRTRLTRVLASALLAAALFLPLVVFSGLSIGRPLPTTFYAKSGPGITRAFETRDEAMARRDLLTFGPAAVGQFAAILEAQLGLVAWLVPLGIVACLASRPQRGAGLLMLTILVVVPYLMGVTAPQRLKPDNVRYAAQLVAPAAALVVFAVSWVVRNQRMAAVLASVAVVATGWRAAAGAEQYAVSVKNISELHVTAGRWLGEHLPPGAVVAVNDVGAIAFFSGLRILDLEGLVSPDVLPYRSLQNRGLQVVMAKHPDYLAIFPHWYPELSSRPDLFQEIYRFDIGDNVISAGATLIVYRTPWARESMR